MGVETPTLVGLTVSLPNRNGVQTSSVIRRRTCSVDMTQLMEWMWPCAVSTIVVPSRRLAQRRRNLKLQRNRVNQTRRLLELKASRSEKLRKASARKPKRTLSGTIKLLRPKTRTRRLKMRERTRRALPRIQEKRFENTIRSVMRRRRRQHRERASERRLVRRP